MKHELFDIGEYGAMYDGIDHLDYKELENINGDNLFLAFLKENGNISLNSVAAIDGNIYNFNTHKFIDNDTEITYARAFSDIMPSTIWRLIHIVNHDIISIDIDDYKSYLIENFDKWYHNKTEEDARGKMLRNGYLTPTFQKLTSLNKETLEHIDGSNIFLAILEKVEKGPKSFREYFQNDRRMMEVTYDGVDICAKLLKSMVKSKEINLPENVSLEAWLDMFKLRAIEDLNRYWYIKMNTNPTTANFIASINGHIFNFCTNQYLNLDEVEINYAAPIDELLSANQWNLSYSDSGKLKCLAITEDAIDTLSTFQFTNSEKVDKTAKAKILKHGYQIKS